MSIAQGPRKPPDPDKGRDPQPKRGEPFNPWRGVCGFYPPDIVSANTELELTDGQKRLYERGVRWCGRKGYHFYGFKTIAEALGKSLRQVERDMATLEEKGLIAHVRRRRDTNLYRFLWHPIFEVQPTALQEDDLEVPPTADQDSILDPPSTVKKGVLDPPSTSQELCKKKNYVRRTPLPPNGRRDPKQQELPGLCASGDARGETSLAKIPRPGADHEGWFEQWWPAYWRKVAKKAAQAAFKKHVKTPERFAQVMTATRTQTAAMMAREPDKRPHGASWLNGERWTDEPSQPARKGPSKSPSVDELAQSIEAFRRTR